MGQLGHGLCRRSGLQKGQRDSHLCCPAQPLIPPRGYRCPRRGSSWSRALATKWQLVSTGTRDARVLLGSTELQSSKQEAPLRSAPTPAQSLVQPALPVGLGHRCAHSSLPSLSSHRHHGRESQPPVEAQGLMRFTDTGCPGSITAGSSCENREDGNKPRRQTEAGGSAGQGRKGGVHPVLPELPTFF